MAVNRFDQAVDYSYVDQYVPIPFDKLFALGKYYADERQKLEKELETNIRTFGKFVSPSSVDTENYYNDSTGTLKPLIQEAVANPSVMKTMDYRSRLQGAINNIDYSQLSQYEQAAQNLRLREQNIAKLQAEGRYNRDMDDIDITNWDTKNMGIMNDLNPIRYQSIREQVEPYVNNLQDQFLYSKGGYNWMGVSPEMVQRQVDANWSSIRNTPIADAHIKAMMKRGMTKEQAENAFRSQALNDSLEYVRKKPVVDPYALAAYQSSLAMRLAAAKEAAKKKYGGTGNSGNVLGLSDMLTGQYTKMRQNRFNGMLINNPEFLQSYQKNTQELQTQIDAISDDLLKNNAGFAKAFEEVKQSLIAKGYKDQNEIEQLAFQTALQSPSVSNVERGRLQAVIEQYQTKHQDAVNEAEGRAIQAAFNKRLGFESDVNPFSNGKINMYVNGNELMYDESKVHDMWEDGLMVMSQPVGPALNQHMLSNLFKSDKKVNEEVGYIIDPHKLISPRSVVLDNNYIKGLITKAGLMDGETNKVKQMHFDRNTWGNDNFDIEERIAKGDFGKVAIDKVEGYIENGDTKGLVVSVNVPYKDIDDVYSRWWFDNPKNTLKKNGFTVSSAPEGTKEGSRWEDGYVTVRMVLGTGDSDLDKVIDNRIFQKEVGTNDTKNAQIGQDDALMYQLNNWTPGLGFNE